MNGTDLTTMPPLPPVTTTPLAGLDNVQKDPVQEEFDMATAEKMHFVTSTIFGTIFVVVGIVGNILSILVWKRKKMQSSTGAYLIGQAIADMGLLIFFFITDSIPMMAPAVKTVYTYGSFFSFIGYPIFFLFVVCSIWFTVGVTVDRYIQVCWISQAKEMCTIKRAMIGLGIITALCFIINFPHFFTYEPVRDRNSSDPAFVLTEYGAGPGSQSYEFWVHCMFLVLAPWVSIFTLNMLIIKQIHKVNKQMDSKKSIKGKEKSKKAEAQLTRLLLTVTFTFLILIALQCITQCFFMLKTGNMRIVSEAFSIAKLGIVINSSINFFLYCLSGRRFRGELRQLLCGIIGRESTSSSYSMSQSSSQTSSSMLSRTKSAAPSTTA